MKTYKYCKSGNYAEVLKEHKIEIHRISEIYFMGDGIKVPEDDVKQAGLEIDVTAIENACCYDGSGYMYDYITRRMCRKHIKNYSTTTSHSEQKPMWETVHGWLRRKAKFEKKKLAKSFKTEVNMFNQYVGRDDVLCVKAKLGSWNWSGRVHSDYKDKDWYLGSCDDWWDKAYCTIYVRVSGLPSSKTAEK